jgi:ribose transport system substrate-binding protein
MKLNRVVMVSLVSLLIFSGFVQVAAQNPAAECETIQYVTSVRTLSNEYWANWVQGAEWWAERNDVADQHTVVVDEGDTQVQVSTLEQIIAEAAGCLVLNVTPTTSSAAESIVEAVEEFGGIVVTQWNKPDELVPYSYQNWVSHISYNGVTGGYEIALDLFEAMGGEGNIVALQGILDTSAAQERFEGLERALEESPGVTLLAEQTADFSRQEAQRIMEIWIIQYGSDIDGVWAANDNMALEAVQAIAAGEMTASALQDAFWQGGVGLEIGARVLRGEMSTADMEEAQRSFYALQTIINGENVESYAEGVSADDLDWSDPFDRIEAQLDEVPSE